MLIDLTCPVENRGISVRTNSETGENYLLLKLFNISEKTITSVNLDVKAFDENGVELASLPVEFTELTALPGELFAENKAISIADIPDARNFIVEVINTSFEDGDIYEADDENLIDYDDSEASLQDALLLRELVPDAVCFSGEYENYWRCTCGRPNLKDAQNCARCSSNKEDVLAKYSSKKALEETLLLVEEEKKQLAAEEEAKRLAKKKKTIKNIITSAIIVASLAVLFVIGYFVRIGILNTQANGAIKNGEYLKAYELYKKSGSPKIAEVTNKVIGNNPANLMFGKGYLAEDSENLYFITNNAYTQTANLIKENKKTKETTILTDAAYNSLNIVGDYIYFINIEGLPCRMTKDGATTETLSESPFYYMCVVGSDIYYLKTDYNNPNGYSEEECQVLAQQGQMETFTRIHKIDANTKKDTLISEEDVYMFSIYGDRIYFITPTQTEDIWAMANLKSMNLEGEDIQTVVDSPVNSFFIKDDFLFYIPCFYEEQKGSQISDATAYNYSVVSMDLKTGTKKTLTEESDLTLDMNISGDSIVILSYNRDEFFGTSEGENENATTPLAELKSYDIKSQKITPLLKEDIISFNICNDEIFVILADGSVARYSSETNSLISLNDDGSAVAVSTDEDTKTE